MRFHLPFVNSLAKMPDSFSQGNRAISLPHLAALALMPACHRIPGPPQIVGQVCLHQRRRLKRHRIQMLIQLRHQSNAKSFHHPRRFHPCFVIREPLLRLQTAHPHINARLRRVPARILRPYLPQPSHRRRKQHHIDIMMMRQIRSRSDLPKSLPPHARLRSLPKKTSGGEA
jgi:hypothetical protein